MISNQMYESFLYESGDLGNPSPLSRNWKEDLIDYGLLNTEPSDTDLQSAPDSVDNSEDEKEEMSDEVSPLRVRVQVHGGILRHDFT